MADFTLEDLKAAAAKKYKGLKIELNNGQAVELRNLLRLSDAERDRIQELQESDAEGINAQFEQLREMVVILADTEPGASNLVSLIGDDNALLVYLIGEWRKQTQAGEAEPSNN